ncbi:hypothetical protein FOB64_003247 [Candida albicans]|uniref:Uncharacterized protein n=1 Tax=Candida albicans TaxID=5476 RepID=A0A8H6C1B0_CANAX|nr:hypothetical protein FOB64_003247 [Candida albicans]
MARRSTRRQAANPVSYRESSDSEAEESFEPEEDDYSTRPTKRKANNKSSSASKKRKKSGTKTSKKSLKQLEEELEENYLYKALSSNEVNIQDIALDWIEEYEEDQVDDKIQC